MTQRKWGVSCSVVSDSLWHHRLQPARLLCGILQAKLLDWVAIPSSRCGPSFKVFIEFVIVLPLLFIYIFFFCCSIQSTMPFGSMLDYCAPSTWFQCMCAWGSVLVALWTQALRHTQDGGLHFQGWEWANGSNSISSTLWVHRIGDQ